MTTAIFHLWSNVPSVGDKTADRRVIAGRGGDLKRVAVKAGTVAPRHEHDFEQFFMVLEGAGVLQSAEGETILMPGLVVHFQPHAWHSARFDEDTVLVEVNFAVR
jgi:quercetin dioxygenase-like cupin family protein